MKGADMITPIGTLNINQIVERKDDLLVSDADIKEMARNVRNKAIDETIEKMKNWLYENNGLSILDIRDIDEIAEQLKGGAV